MKTVDVDLELQSSALEELDVPLVLTDVARYCVTSLGAERILALTPRTNVSALRDELERVQECVNLISTANTLPLHHLEDVRPLLKKSRIVGNFLSAPDLLNVLEAMQTSRILHRFTDEHALQAPYLKTLCEPLLDNVLMERHITDAIDDTGAIRDTASKELMSIRREIHALSARLRTRLQRILKKFGEEELLQDEFITQRDGRFVLPMRAGEKRAVEGIIHGMSSTGQTVFLEPAETFEMNNELSLLRGREQREIIAILTTLTAEISTISHHLEAAFDVMTELDTLIARARYAMDHGGLKPTIVDEDVIELHKVHHPVLIQQAKKRRFSEQKQAVHDVIPLSVSLSSTTRGILISGPNAGGKTVAMKTIGTSLAMAMCGVFPLGTCTTGLHRLYTAIGDHQSIDSNLSTFSSQIIRLRDILSFCDDRALVLIDEICAGTDPAEGGALAAGILDSLIERRAGFIVTTHQSSLKQYALTRPSITNASLAFDETVMRPTFEFLYGVPGNSYAFDLARNVGLPDIVLTRGQGYLGERHDELEKSISAMQRFKLEAEQLKMSAAQELLKAERVRKDYEERLSQVKEKRANVVENAREEAKEILSKANALIENTIRDIVEKEKTAKQAKEDFEKAKSSLLTASSEQRGSGTSHASTREGSTSLASAREDSTSRFTVGDDVMIVGTSNSGTIVTIDDKYEYATIDVNGIKFRTLISQLTSSKPSRAASNERRTLSSESYIAPPADAGRRTMDDQRPTMSLDMRGMRADEGLRALEVFLDNAVLKNHPFVSIIHGKGTGALRKVVHDYLADHHAIESFRLGDIHEGGDGVTIVAF